MKKTLLISIVVLAALCQASCRGCGDDARDADPLAPAVAKLAENGIELTSAELRDGEAIVTYEASKADQYDDQIVEVWGEVFGVMSWFADEKVTIVNTAGGVPMVSITADTDDIHAVTSGRMDTKTFLATVKIKSLEE